MRALLSLDYSTTATGWAKYCLDTFKLISWGVIKPDYKIPKVGKIPVFGYPQAQLFKLRRLADQILELVDDSVEEIVVEEVNRGKSRLGQKVLDAGHFILLDRLSQNHLKKVVYVDSDGSDGWRSKNGLGLQLTEADKFKNKETKKFNEKLAKGQKKLPMITQKTLACRYVNKRFGLNLDADVKATDADIADAIGLGAFYLDRTAHDRTA